MTTPQYLTIEEVTEKLAVNPKTVYRWLKSGRLKGIKLGSGRTAMWRIAENELNNFIKSHGSSPVTENQE